LQNSIIDQSFKVPQRNTALLGILTEFTHRAIVASVITRTITFIARSCLNQSAPSSVGTREIFTSAVTLFAPLAVEWLQANAAKMGLDYFQPIFINYYVAFKDIPASLVGSGTQVPPFWQLT